MASSPELVQYIADQLSPCGTITFKKMFGDDTLFVKPTKAGRALVPDCLLAPPYPGAKDCLLIENVDNRDLLCALAAATCDELPSPKPKKKISK